MRTPPRLVQLVLAGALALGTAACGSNDPDVILNESPAEEGGHDGEGEGKEEGEGH